MSLLGRSGCGGNDMLIEVHAVELPYPTTCYTGVRTAFRFDGDDAANNSDGGAPHSTSPLASPVVASGGGEAEGVEGPPDPDASSIVRNKDARRGVAAEAAVVVVARLAAERNSVEFAFYRPPRPPSPGSRRGRLFSAEGEFRTTVRRLPRVATTRGANGGAAAERPEEWACVAHDCLSQQQTSEQGRGCHRHLEVFAIRRPEHRQQRRESGGGRQQQREDDGSSSVTAAPASVPAAVQKTSSSSATATGAGATTPAAGTTSPPPPPDGRNHGIATTAGEGPAPHDGKSTKLDHPSNSASSAAAVTPTRRNTGQSVSVVDQAMTNDRKGGGGGATTTAAAGHAAAEPSNRLEGPTPTEAYLVVRGGSDASPPPLPANEVDDCEEDEKSYRQRRSGGRSKRRSRHGAVDQVIPVTFQPLVVRLTRFFHGGGGVGRGASSSSPSSVAVIVVGSSDAVAPLRVYLPNGATGDFNECTIVDGARKRSRGGSIDDGQGDPDGDEGEHFWRGDDFGEEDRRSFLPPPPPSPRSSSSQSSSDHHQHPATGSPVMALDACHDAEDGVHYLAVGYQNGCVRVVAYRLPANGGLGSSSSAAAAPPPTKKETSSSKSSSTAPSASPVFAPTVLRASTFLVDGPIVSLCLRLVRRRRRRPRSTTDGTGTATGTGTGGTPVHLVAGSLCGFACSFVREPPKKLDGPSDDDGGGGDEGDGDDSCSYAFEGPFVVTEGLRWRSSGLEGEDGVLAVGEFAFGATRSGTCVAVGTHSGRVLLFEPVTAPPVGGGGGDGDDVGVGGGGRGSQRRRYRLLWTIRLPYPIHGIASADLDGDGLPELLVTTRKSIHVFRVDVSHLANVVKMRFEDIIRLR